MGASVLGRLWSSCLLVLGTALVVFFVGPAPASAWQQVLTAWEAEYSESLSAARTENGCELCHQSRGEPWNGYGWAIRDALIDDTCDDNNDGEVTDTEGIVCVETDDSDGEGSDNITEINASTQPGWRAGPDNVIFFKDGSFDVIPPPDTVSPPYDPDGTGGTGGTGGAGGMGGMGGAGGDDRIPPGQYKRTTIVVRPGQSIQEAIDRAKEGARIYILAGVYKEKGDATNGLNITKNGIQLIGQRTNRSFGQSHNDKDKDKAGGVVIKNDRHRNGIAVVPPEVTECMNCHSSMELPFPLLPGIEPGLPDPMPLVYDIEVRNIRIEGFRNGLFTERVDGFVFDNVESIDNEGYGIFPTLSYNGVISNSYARGSDDSGIWVETSENVLVTNNLVEENVNGFEVSNSDNILLIDNEARGNTVGAAILLLPDIFDDRPGATHIDMVNNWIHDNNKENTAGGGILGELPPGIGILYLGVDHSLMSGNLVENNGYTGIAIADYCAVVTAIPDQRFWCGIDPDTLTPGFLQDQSADDNSVEGNVLINNAGDPPDPPFGDFAAPLSLLTLPASWIGIPGGDERPYHGNCYENNQTSPAPGVLLEFFSLFDAFVDEQTGGQNPPPWPPPPCL
jgi:parallel beta-helix repeat protein